ncbi:MAG: DinB family protein [Streptosporangiaceae bacterium]
MTWIAPDVQRNEPAEPAAERAGLQCWLDYHRATLLFKCQGLVGDQLVQRTAEPSTLSLLGLVRHMAEVERSWFCRRLPGQLDLPRLYCSEEYPDGDFDLVDASEAEAAFETFRAECAAADAAAAGRSLDDTFVLSDGTTLDLRWIYLHMIEEYARHNGHADILRERLDGVTGD